MLNGDGKFLEINETYMAKHMPNMKYSDVADKNISMKMDFWLNVFRTEDELTSIKALVRIDFGRKIKIFDSKNISGEKIAK